MSVYLSVCVTVTGQPGDQRTAAGTSSLVLPCESQELNTGHQAWQVACFPAKSFSGP